MRRCLFLASALLLALVASSEAVVCDSFKQRSECENIVTDAGICGWDEAAAKCVVTQRLPYGMVGITSVKPPQKVENRSAPGGKRELKAVDGTFEPCVDKPTPEGFTCAQQKAWKKCSEPWMIEGGFCRITCGVCTPGAPSTPAVPNVLVPDTLPAAQEAAAPAVEVDPGFCTLPPVTGPCRAAMPRWYFDAANRKCMPFIYGGCQGNANNFETFAQCDAAAAMACNVGPSINGPTVTVRRMWQP